VWAWLLGVALCRRWRAVAGHAGAHQAFDSSLQDEAAALAARVTWSDRGPLLDVSRQTLELLTWDASDRNSFVMVDADGAPLAGDAERAGAGDRVRQPSRNRSCSTACTGASRCAAQCSRCVTHARPRGVDHRRRDHPQAQRHRAGIAGGRRAARAGDWAR
jgi:hypothetical protein